MATRLEINEAKMKKLKLVIDRQRAKIGKQARRDDTRVKILVGAFVRLMLRDGKEITKHSILKEISNMKSERDKKFLAAMNKSGKLFLKPSRKKDIERG